MLEKAPHRAIVAMLPRAPRQPRTRGGECDRAPAPRRKSLGSFGARCLVTGCETLRFHLADQLVHFVPEGIHGLIGSSEPACRVGALDVGHMASRRQVGFVPYDDVPRRIPDQISPVTIGAAIKLSCFPMRGLLPGARQHRRVPDARQDTATRQHPAHSSACPPGRTRLLRRSAPAK